MRLRLTPLACVAALVLAAASPTAASGTGGGAAAPSAKSLAAPSGGTAVGQRPAAKRKAARRRPAVKRRRTPASTRKPAKPPVPAEPLAPSGEAAHRFPVAGTHSLGGQDARFGVRRSGHRHQGQDVTAAEGTPVVAPWAGLVEYVRFQRSGAGWYIVLDGDGEDRDYVFMHLRTGSILVTAGQRVSAGQQLAQVGTTGRSSGPHLHFEIWTGGWYEGGEPVDPLPLLQQWAR